MSKGLASAANSNNSLISSAANTLGNITGTGIFDTALNVGRKLAKSRIAQDLGKQALNKGIPMAANSNNSLISGAANAAKSITGGKLIRGSQEAKDKMARIRAMRKTGAGFNFIKTIKKSFKNPVLKQIGNVALTTALLMALKVAGNIPLGMVANGVIQSQSVSQQRAK